MLGSKNDSKSTESRRKRDHSVSSQRSLMSFFAKKIRYDEIQTQDQSKILK